LVRVLVAQRGHLMLCALTHMLQAEGDVQVVGEVSETTEVSAAIDRCRPEVTVLDAAMPKADELIASLYESLTGSRLLVLIDAGRTGLLGRSLPRGTPRVGFISTDATPDTLVEAIRRTARGEPFVDPELAVAALTARDNPLTARERDVLELAASGEPNIQIAQKLFIANGTVRNYMSRAIAKTGGRNKIEAIKIAQAAGWL
jgi:two-component system response regulator DesR